MIKKILTALVLFLFLSSCLKTRSEVGSQYQSQVYSKKQAENQSIEPVPSSKPIDERDELIRQMNGRIENLEYQVTALNQELTSLKQLLKEDPRILALQESVQKLENQSAHSNPPGTSPVGTRAGAVNEGKTAEVSDKIKSSDENLGLKIDPKKLTSFEIAQDYFIKKDFKNAILEYQNFVEKHSKSQAKLLPEAKYKMGLCFEALGLKDEAKSFYEEVASQYPNTEFGKKAKSKVNKKKN